MIAMRDAREALDRIFRARSVALVGASNDPKKYGYMTLDSLMKGGYGGRLYPVNSKGGEILGLPAFPSLESLPETPDLVVIVVPAAHVAGVLGEAGRMGVRGAVVLTAGFREAGRPDLEADVASAAREAGIRFVGPNVQGVTYLPNRLCAMFFPVITVRGPIAVISQSGTVTAALAEWAEGEGLGISAAVNLGNQTDLCESDYLEWFAEDEHTRAIAMYIEGVKDGRRFLETLRRVAAVKPVAILKGGRTEAGRKAAASHTGSLAGSHEVFSAACRQVGAVCAETLEHLYDAVKALATLAPPEGPRVLTVSTSGGAGTLGADAAALRGLALPALSPACAEDLRGAGLSPLATLANPLDCASISAAHMQSAALIADRHGAADVIVLNFGDPVPGALEAALEVTAAARARVVVTYFGGGEEEKLARPALHRAGIPVYPTPERAMAGVAAAAWTARWRRERGLAPSREKDRHDGK